MGKRIHKKRWLIFVIGVVVVLSAAAAAYKYIYIDDILNSSKTIAQRTEKIISQTEELVRQGKTSEAIELLKTNASTTRYDPDAADYLRYAAVLSAKSDQLDAAVELAESAETKRSLPEDYIKGVIRGAYEQIATISKRIEANYPDAITENERLVFRIDDLRELEGLLYATGNFPLSADVNREILSLYDTDQDVDVPDDSAAIQSRIAEIEART